MKKKLMMIAVLLGALSLGACVDDNESASVTDLRGAKAEQLRSLAALNEAKAEAELIRANAEAALKEAKAAHEQALADNQQIENDKIQQEYALYLEKLQLESELQILQAQAELENYQDHALTSKYSSELSTLFSLQQSLISAKIQLAKAEAGLTDAQTSLEQIKADQGEVIAEYKAKLEVLTSDEYKALDDAELQAQAASKRQEADLAETKFASDPTCAALLNTVAPLNSAVEIIDEQSELISIANANYNVISGFGNFFKTYYKFTAVAYSHKTNGIARVDYQKNMHIDDAVKYDADKYYADEVEKTAGELGKETDKSDAKYNGVLTAYANKAYQDERLKNAQTEYAKYNALKDGETIKDATRPGSTVKEEISKTDGLQIWGDEIEDANEAIADAKEYITQKKAEYDDAVANQKEYTDALAAVDLDAYNKAVSDFETAYEAYETAYDAWTDAKQVVTDLRNEADALQFMADYGAADIDNLIADLNKNIANAEKVISDAENAVTEADVVAIWTARVEAVELQIEVQKQIVEAAKEALEASINETPAEDTPAEDETPSEEQPAA